MSKLCLTFLFLRNYELAANASNKSMESNHRLRTEKDYDSIQLT